MKIKQAIKKAKKHKCRIWSKKAGMYHQDAKSLTHWLLVSDNRERNYKDVINADDWELDTRDLVADTPATNLVADTLEQVKSELSAAMAAYPTMNSPHEGYAVIAEELDELWDLVKVKQSKHDLVAMRSEAVQIAAMAIRFAIDLTHKGAQK